MLALSRYARKVPSAAEELAGALERLRLIDAKQRLCFALLVAAELDLETERFETAHERATEALHLASLLQRPSEIVLARCLLARASRALALASENESHLAVLQESLDGLVSLRVRELANHLIGERMASLEGQSDGCNRR
jgi:hypothetical protein